MVARITSETLFGLQGHAVEVEADVVAAAPAFSIVGLPDAAVQESRERVRAAIVNSGFEFPSRRITVNLAPADLRKEGPGFDLPIALAFLLATGQARRNGGGEVAALGELGLDGAVRAVSGVLVVVESLRRRGVRRVLVPAANAAEAGLVGGVGVVPVRRLRDAVGALAAAETVAAAGPDVSALLGDGSTGDADFADVAGQAVVKRALEIAAAGGHNVLMVGPPGSGKTMLARRLPTIMPALTVDEAIAVTRVHSVAGLLPSGVPLVTRRPFRSPHHSISVPGLIGGGSSPRPGEVSLAHLGVLFLDEFPEFRLSALEALRQPLEDGEVTISRALASVTYPARITLVAAMNPCPCGFKGDRERHCTCPGYRLQQYGSRLSGPLLDRVDLRLVVARVPPREHRLAGRGESSAAVRARVELARRRQRARFVEGDRFGNGDRSGEGHRSGEGDRSSAGTGAGRVSASVDAVATGVSGAGALGADALRSDATPAGSATANAHMTARQLRRLCHLDADAVSLLDRAYDRLHLSARACDRVVKVAQTIADLEGASTIAAAHIAESLSYRGERARGG